MAFAAALAAFVAGCAEPTTGRITGAITVDGKPAKSGSIAFIPIDGRGATTGAPIIDGRYDAEAQFNEFKVEIRVPKVVGEKKLYDAPESPVKKILAETLPSRYHDESELRVEIKPGENRQDFDVTTH